jgi:hypothetical protein
VDQKTRRRVWNLEHAIGGRVGSGQGDQVEGHELSVADGMGPQGASELAGSPFDEARLFKKDYRSRINDERNLYTLAFD